MFQRENNGEVQGQIDNLFFQDENMPHEHLTGVWEDGNEKEICRFCVEKVLLAGGDLALRQLIPKGLEL